MDSLTARIHQPGSSSCNTIRDFSVSTESTALFSEKPLLDPETSVKPHLVNTGTRQTSVLGGGTEVTWQIPPSPEPDRLASASHSRPQHSRRPQDHFPVSLRRPSATNRTRFGHGAYHRCFPMTDCILLERRAVQAPLSLTAQDEQTWHC
jgi:hypothetical protein